MPSIGHQNRRVAPGSNTQACAHPRYGLIVHGNGIRDAFGTRVEGRFGVDLVEPGVERLRRVEMAHDGLLVARQAPLRLLLDLLALPAHERMFAYRPDD